LYYKLGEYGSEGIRIIIDKKKGSTLG